MNLNQNVLAVAKSNQRTFYNIKIEYETIKLRCYLVNQSLAIHQ